MKIILFCKQPYAFSILKPLADELEKLGYAYLWYVTPKLAQEFPYKPMPFTSKIQNLEMFESDIIFAPGNSVPYWLQGLKVQIFHGLAGEKKGHFRIRDYFDLYLTQGPYFTKKFQKLAQIYKNFDVIETGWCKLDNLYAIDKKTIEEKKALLKKYNVKNIILYAPTFSSGLTSALKLIDIIKELSNNDNILVIIKFHDKMDQEIKEKYQIVNTKNLIISDKKDITPLLQISDLMISDTSSVVYEFTLLNKPVVTLNSHSENINWENITDENNIKSKVLEILNGLDNFKKERTGTIEKYHPYLDGKSASRVITAAIASIEKHGVPKKRELPLLRKWKMYLKWKIVKKYS